MKKAKKKVKRKKTVSLPGLLVIVCLLNLNGKIVTRREKFIMTNVNFLLALWKNSQVQSQVRSQRTNDIKKHFSYDNHKAIVDSWKRQTEKNCIFSCRQADTVSKETD